MSYITLYQSNFSQGEFTDWLLGRGDIAQYGNSVRKAKNAVVRPQGGIMKRPGTVFVETIKDENDENTELWEFLYSDTDAYILEVGNQYMRFYRNDAQIITPTSTQLLANSEFTSDISSWSLYLESGASGTIGWNAANGGSLEISHVSPGTTAAAQSIFLAAGTYTLQVARPADGSGQCGVRIGTSFSAGLIYSGNINTNSSINTTITVPVPGTYTVYLFRTAATQSPLFSYCRIIQPGFSPVELNTPWTSAELKDCEFAQVFDSLYVVHPNHAPRVIKRVSHTQWTIDEVTFIDGPYYDLSDRQYGGVGTEYTLNPSATSGSITVSASSPLFVSTDVGRLIRFRTIVTNPWGYMRITAVNSSTSVDATVIKTLDATGASSQWRLGMFSDTTGWPSTITFNEQRMVLARTRSEQQAIWFSKAGDITDFSPDGDEDKDDVSPNTAMSYRIQDNVANVIYSAIPLRGLNLISSGGVWLAKASLQGEALTSENLSITKIVGESAGNVKPEVIGSNIFYVDRTRRKVLELGYSFQDDAFDGVDIAMLAEHRTQDPVKQIIAARVPNYLIYTLGDGGSLSACTYIRKQNVNAWTHFDIGGDDVKIENMACIPHNREDRLWMIVKRTIDGQTRRYVEYVAPYRIHQDDESDAIYMDSAISYEGSPTDELHGLDHLEGQEVACFGDGAVVPVLSPVTNGEIQLQVPVSKAWVGLPYNLEIETNQLVSAQAQSLLQGREGRIHSVVLRLFKSYSGYAGEAGSPLQLLSELNSNTPMDAPIQYYTGDKEIILSTSYSLNPRIIIKHDIPVAFNLLSITYKGSVSSR